MPGNYDNNEIDAQVHAMAFDFLKKQAAIYGDVIARTILERSFEFQGHNISLIGPQGIFRPAILPIPISITSVPIIEGRERPYDDEVGANIGIAETILNTGIMLVSGWLCSTMCR